MGFDNCPICDRRITDNTADGMEVMNGQRWCIVHKIADHLEMIHEVEIAPGTTDAQIREMHNSRHAHPTDWPPGHYQDMPHFMVESKPLDERLRALGYKLSDYGEWENGRTLLAYDSEIGIWSCRPMIGRGDSNRRLFETSKLSELASMIEGAREMFTPRT